MNALVRDFWAAVSQATRFPAYGVARSVALARIARYWGQQEVLTAPSPARTITQAVRPARPAVVR